MEREIHLTRFSERTKQFNFFDKQLDHPDWTGKTVLDFGGNIGGFLRGAGNRVEPENYWCLDLDKEVLERGQHAFPRAHFVFYNRYSFEYNPKGIKGLPVLDLGRAFDYIVAFSVFNHTLKEDMLVLVSQLRAMLKPGGALAFTFNDPLYDRVQHPDYDPSSAAPDVHLGNNLRRRLHFKKAREKGIDVEAMLARVVGAAWCMLVNDQLYVEPEDTAPMRDQAGGYALTYYTPAYLKTLFPDAEILPPPHPGDRQSGCVLRKSPLASTAGEAENHGGTY